MGLTVVSLIMVDNGGWIMVNNGLLSAFDPKHARVSHSWLLSAVSVDMFFACVAIRTEVAQITE